MAFKLKGFPQHKGVNSFKPGPPNTEFSHNWDNNDSEVEGNFSTGDTYTGGFGEETPSLIQEKKEQNDAIKEVTDGEGVKKDADGNPITNDDDNTTGGSAGAELKTTSDKYNPDGTLKEGDKKWHEKDAFRNTGVGHITDAVKSIGRGIKNIRTKNKAKKAERLSSAKEAVGSGTETLKQAKTVERNRRKTDTKAKRNIKKAKKDKKKLAEYRKKNPVRGKEAINAFANQTNKS